MGLGCAPVSISDMGILKIAACQLNPTVGDVEANTNRIISVIERAKKRGASLVIFPELAISGYPPEDLLAKPSYIDKCHKELGRLTEATVGITAVVGTIELDGQLYNAAAVLDNGKLVSFVRKEILPNYLVFDEKRYFAPGNGPARVFDKDGVLFGVTICEDAWFNDGPISKVAKLGAEIIININASPYSIGKRQTRAEMLKDRCRESQVSIVYVNQVGGQDELVFDGASMVYDRAGALTLLGESFIEEVVYFDYQSETFSGSSARAEIAPGPIVLSESNSELSPQGIERLDDFCLVGSSSKVADPTLLAAEFKPQSWSKLPFVPLSESIDDAMALETYQALIVGTRDYVVKNGFQEVVLGLSGGIDSSLVATIATDALGPEHVHCVAMPSRYSSVGSLTDAQDLAKRLGVDLIEIPIEMAHQAYLEMSSKYLGDRFQGLTEENLQSRIRGVLLMALSNQRNWLVLTTGNKSELATGYSTLYGDTAGGYGVIKDLSKTMVYRLAELRNRLSSQPVIPETVLKKPPSAELRPDQRDDQSLPPYEVLDPIVESLVELEHSTAELIEAGFEVETVLRVARLIDINEYKRRQNPPGVRVTQRAFGKDRRVPITNGFKPWRTEI